MEFHDVLHGRIIINQVEFKSLVEDLLNTTELQRLRNMRQMNFDVPLIQELGRSRRLPHSIGVTHIAVKLALKAALPLKQTKELISAALLHDAAIPPYGHLVETEFKKNENSKFDHAKILESFILGNFAANRNSYSEILPGRYVEVHKVLEKHRIDPDAVLKLVAPPKGQSSPIAADVDIDNIDNVHRMAIMLGWDGARENLNNLMQSTSLNQLKEMHFSDGAIAPLNQWLDYRQRIYTLIIAHPDCIAHNSYQADLVELADKSSVISPEKWYMSEPEFEEQLRKNEKTKSLASQLLSGCEYSFIDYVWIKNIGPHNKLNNGLVKDHLNKPSEFGKIDTDYFIWYERGLISREITWKDEHGKTKKLGENSSSCMIAVVKKTRGGSQGISKTVKNKWRHRIIDEFKSLSKTNEFTLAFPEDYSGSYFDGTGGGRDNFELELQ